MSPIDEINDARVVSLTRTKLRGAQNKQVDEKKFDDSTKVMTPTTIVGVIRCIKIFDLIISRFLN